MFVVVRETACEHHHPRQQVERVCEVEEVLKHNFKLCTYYKYGKLINAFTGHSYFLFLLCKLITACMNIDFALTVSSLIQAQ